MNYAFYKSNGLFFFSTTQLFFSFYRVPLVLYIFLATQVTTTPLTFLFLFLYTIINRQWHFCFIFFSVSVYTKINFRQECCFLLLRRIDQQKKKNLVNIFFYCCCEIIYHFTKNTFQSKKVKAIYNLSLLILSFLLLIFLPHLIVKLLNLVFLGKSVSLVGEKKRSKQQKKVIFKFSPLWALYVDLFILLRAYTCQWITSCISSAMCQFVPSFLLLLFLPNSDFGLIYFFFFLAKLVHIQTIWTCF